ncbi:HEAT repeat protein-like protein [Phyllosticta citrichinensis]|uniref:HEAT repeat protein-like protein n=1 Tax=Phyllosticta citrichinensis TaxID=1130410 RepID=A0ABR1XK94_9PEZI
MERRQQIFRLLKPHCVQLSQAVLELAANNGNPKQVVSRLSSLLVALREAASTPDALDAKLTDYVFFPLSYVLREREKLPAAAVELTLECITVLLQSGWRSNMNPDLSHQILLLATGFAGGSPGQKATNSSEELQTAAFRCLDRLFTNYRENDLARKSLTDVKNMGPLGHSVMVILESIQNGPSTNVQVAASNALFACCAAVQDRDALASIMPKIVSTLSTVLVPSTQQRRSYETFQCSLQTLSHLFKTVLADEFTENLPSTTETGESGKQLNQSWLQATASWIKKALANVIRIRHHERSEVRHALLDLCLVVLQDCKTSLKYSAAMMVETMVVLCGADGDSQATSTVRHVLLADPKFVGLLRSTIHNWAISLPRVMTSSDDSVKRTTINQISTAYHLLSESGVDLGLVDRTLALNLRDGISTALLESSKKKEIVETTTLAPSMDLTASTTAGASLEFEQILYENESQRAIAADLRRLVENVSMSKSSSTAARELVETLHSSRGAQQVASFWTALQLLRSENQQDSILHDFLAIDDGAMSPHEELLEELYSFSLDTLQQHHVEAPHDWRIQALALETIAFQAQKLRDEFRIELVDALYPIVHLVGSSHSNLRSHAATALNIIAAACGYNSVGALIVENVDYLVNAVALKLNTFDISPQAPQVLLMMIKLSGPSLLPYLDDLVGSIFAALESFHGYPRLVELLFRVLRGIADEGVKTPQLAITSGQEESDAHVEQMTSIQDVLAALDDLQQREAKQDDPVELGKAEFPRTPWKDADKGKSPLVEEIDDEDDEQQQQEEEEEEPAPPSAPDLPPPAPATYALLLKITSLTQHYLSSPSPTLRTSLLSLLSTTLPPLAKHENTFLPLVNTLWPTLVPRLADSEAYVVEGACDVMAIMCTHGGDFVRGRVDAVWRDLLRLYEMGGASSSPTKPSASTSTSTSNKSSMLSLPSRPKPLSSSPSPSPSSPLTPQPAHQTTLYTTAPSRIIRAALTRLFAAIITHVTVADNAFDQALALLLPLLVAAKADAGGVNDAGGGNLRAGGTNNAGGNVRGGANGRGGGGGGGGGAGASATALLAAFERRNADAVWLALVVCEGQKRDAEAGSKIEELVGWRRPRDVNSKLGLRSRGRCVEFARVG